LKGDTQGKNVRKGTVLRGKREANHNEKVKTGETIKGKKDEDSTCGV